MKLHGFEVDVNDRVYHLRYGIIRVSRVEKDCFYVELPMIGPVVVTEDGRVGGFRMVFWHDPIMIPPMKDESTWKVVVAGARAMTSAIQTGIQNGTIKNG